MKNLAEQILELAMATCTRKTTSRRRSREEARLFYPFYDFPYMEMHVEGNGGGKRIAALMNVCGIGERDH